MPLSLQLHLLMAQRITAESFKPYGQLIIPLEDEKPYGSDDAQLNLSQGTPRFYVMRLKNQGQKFHKITRHSRCTQCLGSLGGKEWLIAVAPPSKAPRPDLKQLMAFCIPGDGFIKLETGTWHSGPYFEGDRVDFYNLELSDTNEIDHFTYDFARNDNLEFEIVQNFNS